MTALVIQGRIVTMADGATTEPFDGRVWMRGDRIEAVTQGGAVHPGFEGVPIVDVGASLVMPGFIDMHNHLAYAAQPLWSEPGRTEPWLHNKHWPGADTYTERITEPAWTFAKAAAVELLGYVQIRLLAGGATSAQGWPQANRGYHSAVRNVDSERGDAIVPEPFRTSVVTKTDDQLRAEITHMQTGTGFIYHCAEGQRGSRVLKDFTDLAGLAGLLPTLVAIHCCAVDQQDWDHWPIETAGGIVWSPLSNVVLYADTTLVPHARARNIVVCLGSDWGPSGTKNLLGEMKVARITSDHFGYGLSDADIVEMITSNPGNLLERAWKRPVGRLVEGGFADVLVMRPHTTGSVWSQIVAATETDIDLVVVGGKPLYGEAKLFAATGSGPSFKMNLAGKQRRVGLTDPKDPTAPWSWTAIKKRLDEVQRDPQLAISGASARAGAGLRAGADSELEFFLDMPDSRRTGRAGPPKNPGLVRIDQIPSLIHDKAFFDRLEAEPIHKGVLDPLRAWWNP